MGRRELLACVLIICFFQFSYAQDLIEVATQQNLTTLVAAIQWQNLTDIFNQTEANITLFGPTDAAFNTYSANITSWNETGALADILKYHTLSKIYREKDANFTNNLIIEDTLLSGGWIRVNIYNNSIYLNGVVKVGVTDVNATNGELQILNDTILIPPTLNTDMNKTLSQLLSEKFLTLYEALNKTELYRDFESPEFSSDNAFTFFAPTQEAFDKVPVSIIANLLRQENNDTLISLLKYHVVQGVYFSTAFEENVNTELTTLNGEKINVTVNSTGLEFNVNNANVTASNIIVRNGVIHGINDLLIPPGFQFPANTVLDVMFEEGLFTMIEAIGWQNLTSVFSDPKGNFTIFVPTNLAFTNLQGLQALNESGELKTYLQFHAIQGNVSESDLANEQIINNTLASGFSYIRVNIYRGVQFYLNGYAKIIKSNIYADNGVVHIIDSVLIPNENTTANNTIGNILEGVSNFTIFVEELNKANLFHLLNDDVYNPAYTVFAPTNAAFEGIPTNLWNVIQSLPDVYNPLLQYTIVNGSYFSSAFPGFFFTLETSNITVSLYGNQFYANDAKITSKDIQAKGGVIHVIDKFLLTPTFKLPENATLLLDVAYVEGLTELVQYVKWQGLEETLSVNSSVANYTIFAPSNIAFDQDPNINNLNATGQLQDILKYHVTNGSLDQDIFEESITIPETLADFWLRVNVYPTGVFLNGVNELIRKDINASNGMIQVIDGVLSIPSNLTILQAIETNYTVLHSAIAANPTLSAALGNPDMFHNLYTLFAPTDKAFDILPKGFLDVLKLPENEDILNNILSTYVLNNDYYTTAFNGSQLLTNLAGTVLNVSGNAFVIAVNGTVVYSANHQTRNGVVHSLDTVFLPDQLPVPFQSNIIDYLFVKKSGLYNLLVLEELESTFQGTDNYTLFVPSNSALAQLNVTYLNATGELKNVLLYHALAGNLNSTQLRNDEAYVTASTDTEAYLRVNVYPSGVYLNGVTKVVEANVNVSNGLIHVIDSVLFPPNATNGHNLTIAESLLADPRFTNLTAALNLAGLVDFFKNDSLNPDNVHTVFAPTDDAFQTLPPGVLNALLKPQNTELLKNILTFHVLKGGFFTPFYENGQTTQETLAGSNVTVTRNGNTITVGKGSASVTEANKQYRNGVVHVINKVLLSPAFTNTSIGLLESSGLTSFLQVLNRLNLTEEFLSYDQPITVFAPTNAAFAKININEVSNDTLYYHVLNGILESSQFKNNDALTTRTSAQNNWLRTNVYSSGTYLNGNSKVVTTNLRGASIIVHEIDTVLSIPTAAQSQSFEEFIKSDDKYSTLLKALNQTNLLSSFNPKALYPVYTYFVPTNDAFNALGSNKDFLLKPENNQTLINVLRYHIAQGAWFTPSFTDISVDSAYSIGDEVVKLNLTSSPYAVNKVKVVAQDSMILNGVVQGIDRVLIPRGVSLPVDQRAIIIGASVGGGVALIILIIIIVICVRRNKGDYEPIRS